MLTLRLRDRNRWGSGRTDDKERFRRTLGVEVGTDSPRWIDGLRAAVIKGKTIQVSWVTSSGREIVISVMENPGQRASEGRIDHVRKAAAFEKGPKCESQDEEEMETACD